MFTYKIDSNGYHIYDDEDPNFHIHQYEPYIPNHSISYEENAQNDIKKLEERKKAQTTYTKEYEELRSDVDYLMLLNDTTEE